MNYPRCLLAAFCLLLFVTKSQTQTVPADLENLLNETLDSMRTVLSAKSLSAAMQFPDGAIWAHADGISSANPLVNVTPEHVYLIGSVTKTLTSACILQLADEGVLSINDSLYQWLDTLPYINPNITIRQLLQHTSGIHDVLSTEGQQDSLLADMSRIWTPEELISVFIRPPAFQPGAAWSYSNTNYFLLGMIIKKATGNEFYTELRNRFYQPLGLGSFYIPAFEPNFNLPIAHVWLNLNADNILDDAHFFYSSWLSLNSTAGAAGGYYSTPTDCTKWMHTYMRGDLLSAEMMANAKTVVSSPDLGGLQYGLGLMKNTFLGNIAYGHGGDLAYHASSWYFPEKDVSITVFTNDSNEDSWDLLPVVRELLRECENYEPVSGVGQAGETGFMVSTYPNPFDNYLSVSLQLPKAADAVDLVLTNAMGHKIKSMHQANLPAGESNLKMDGLVDLVTGIYFLKVSLEGVPYKTLKLVR